MSAYKAIDNGNDWTVNLLSWDYAAGDYVQSADDLSRALAQIYCQYQ
ncbi:MAG: hypothetical protein Q9M92_00555 [Enterobacterales bacterium]|nr:hypothetical protein [Enterobacterales bacterium]